MLIHWIWLATRPHISDMVKVELVQQFGDAEGVYFAGSWSEVEGLTQEGVEALGDRSLTVAQEILDECDRTGLRILTYRDAAYPKRLQNIPDPPLIFYYKGRLPDFDALPVIGVVGGVRHG